MNEKICVIRISAEIHKKAKMAACDRLISLTKYVEEAIKKALEKNNGK